jgi:hypothetical protein
MYRGFGHGIHGGREYGEENWTKMSTDSPLRKCVTMMGTINTKVEVTYGILMSASNFF